MAHRVIRLLRVGDPCPGQFSRTEAILLHSNRMEILPGGAAGWQPRARWGDSAWPNARRGVCSTPVLPDGVQKHLLEEKSGSRCSRIRLRKGRSAVVLLRDGAFLSQRWAHTPGPAAALAPGHFVGSPRALYLCSWWGHRARHSRS